MAAVTFAASLAEVSTASSGLLLNITTLPSITTDDSTTELAFALESSTLLDNITALTNITEETGTEGPLYAEYDYTPDTTGTEEPDINPFLANDYDYYESNNLEPYDYSAVDAKSKKEEYNITEVWKNVDALQWFVPKPYVPMDLNKYFLLTPPFTMLFFLLLVFMPCLIMKWRDDVREINGKPRKFGVNRNLRVTNVVKESYQSVDPEWHLGTAGGGLTSSQDVSNNAQHNPHVANGHLNTYVKTNGMAQNVIKKNQLYTEENEVSAASDRTTEVDSSRTATEPPADYNEDGVVMDKKDSDDEVIALTDCRQSGDECDGRVAGVDEVKDDNFSTTAKNGPKFTGWNRDLYSSEQGFGPPPTRKSSSPNNKSSVRTDDPAWVY